MKFSAFRLDLRAVCFAIPLAVILSFQSSYAAPGRFGAPDSAIVDEIDRTNLLRIVGKLSGADTIRIDGDTVQIMTRYALGPQIASARSYLLREIRAMGYEPAVQRFILAVATPDLTGTAFSAVDQRFWTADAEGQVYRASASEAWPQFEKCGNVGAFVYDLECDTQGRLWAACRLPGSASGGLFLSTNGGETWSLSASSSFTYALGAITFEDAVFGMAAGSNGSVMRTGDGGETWWPIDPQILGYETLMGSATNGAMHFWFVTDSGALYETLDLGGTWSRRSLLNGRLAGIDFHGESTGVIAGNQHAI